MDYRNVSGRGWRIHVPLADCRDAENGSLAPIRIFAHVHPNYKVSDLP